MTVRFDYSINNDRMYLVMWQDAHDFSRWFFGGPEPLQVKRGELVPENVKHTITTPQMIQLLDALLEAGIRPSSNAWSAGHVSDLKKHIEFAERMATALLPKSGE